MGVKPETNSEMEAKKENWGEWIPKIKGTTAKLTPTRVPRFRIKRDQRDRSEGSLMANRGSHANEGRKRGHAKKKKRKKKKKNIGWDDLRKAKKKTEGEREENPEMSGRSTQKYTRRRTEKGEAMRLQAVEK